jgi:uncharacterized protein
MATKTKSKAKTVKVKQKKAASLVWFEIPADDVKRAQNFYGKLFGWKINPFRGMPDFLHIATAGADASPDGALMTRKQPHHTITNYINVDSVSKYAAKIEKLGGKICMPKTAVSQMGYFAVCTDTENNMFGIWESNPKAK